VTRSVVRRAEFIWRPRQLSSVSFGAAPQRLPDEAQRFMYFRRGFVLRAVPAQAPVLATADGRYQLFVNGVRVARGPARSSAACGQLDPIDLAPFLRPGRNVLAALAHAYGRHNAWYELPGWDAARAFGCGGFFLQGEVDDGGGQVLRLDTGSGWRCLEASAWRRGVPANSLGTAEIFDARLSPPWTEVEFDDTDWPAAEALCVAGRAYTGDVRPFQHLSLRDIPAQREAPPVAARVVAWREVAALPASEDVAAQMTAELETAAPQALQHVRFDPASAIAQTADTAHALSLVYDFGEVLAGYIGFELDGPAGAVLDFYPGEQMMADGRVRIFDGIAGYDAPIGHRYVLKDGPQHWQRFEWNGLRYLQLTLRDCARPLRLKAVTLTPTGYPVQPRGSFACSDPLLNRIWQAGATTLARCMHDAYIDCPSREQRQWMDAYVAARINYVAFGDGALAARAIRQFAESQRPDGLTMMAAPGDFSLAGFTNIPDFCLYWILMIGDHRLFVDDPALADAVYPAVAKALQWFERQLDDDHLLGQVPMWVFVDWAETDKRGQVTALNALYVAALQVAAELARQVGHERAAAAYDGTRARVLEAVNRHLWDEARGVYVDARRDGRQSRRISQQTNAAVVAFGVAPPERRQRIWQTVLDPARLVLTHALGADGRVTPFDEETQVVRAQPFSCHVLHRALRLDGRSDNIVQHIRQAWAPLLADGETTLREVWQLDAVTSQCHAWSGTPTFDLSSDVLGVAPLQPGCRRLRVAPQPAGLRWARGVFPAPQGDLAVAWTCSGDQFDLEVSIPAGCEAELQPPPGWAWTEAGPAVVGSGSHRRRALRSPAPR
jgi:hypothetical protein